MAVVCIRNLKGQGSSERVCPKASLWLAETVLQALPEHGGCGACEDLPRGKPQRPHDLMPSAGSGGIGGRFSLFPHGPPDRKWNAHHQENQSP